MSMFTGGYLTVAPFAWDGADRVIWPVCPSCGALIARPDLHGHDEADVSPAPPAAQEDR